MNDERLLQNLGLMCIVGLVLISFGCVSTPSTTLKMEKACSHIHSLVNQAKGGDANAQHRVARLHVYGTCLPKDHVKAVEWYKKASIQGYSKSMVKLADAYIVGRGVEKDLDEAEKWYRLADAEKGLKKVMRLREVLPVANDLFSRIALVVPRSGSQIDAPQSTIKGVSMATRLIAVPLALTLTFLSEPPRTHYLESLFTTPRAGKIQALQTKLTAVYERHANYDVPYQLQTQIVQEINSQLSSDVFVEEVGQISGTNPYLMPTHAKTLLEIKPVTVGLQLMNTKEARFLLIVNYRVIRVSDEMLLKEGEIRHASIPKELNNWYAEGEVLLSTELQKGYTEISKDVVSKLLSIAANESDS